eukprot:625203-Amphidinium_carterae.2
MGKNQVRHPVSWSTATGSDGAPDNEKTMPKTLHCGDRPCTALQQKKKEQFRRPCPNHPLAPKAWQQNFKNDSSAIS